MLHPSLLDAALQASLGLGVEGGETLLPFALERLEVYAALPAAVWDLVRPRSEGTNGLVYKLDLELVDQGGRVCARLTGFSSRALGRRDRHRLPRQLVTTLAPIWDVAASSNMGKSAVGRRLLVIAGGTRRSARHFRSAILRRGFLIEQTADIEAIAEDLQGFAPFNHLLWVVPRAVDLPLVGEAMIVAQEHGVSWLSASQGADSARYGRPAVWVNGGDTAGGGSGYGRCHPSSARCCAWADWLARQRISAMAGAFVDLPSEGAWPLEVMLARPADSQGDVQAYRLGQWYRQSLLPCEVAVPQQPAYRQGGIYLILGGAGGIGEALSEYLIRTYQAQTIWIGRRVEDEAIAAKRQRLAQYGPKPFYLSADAGDQASLAAALETVKARFGALHGVVHATIVLKDQSLARMEEASFVAALAAKVDVSVRLAEVFKAEPLDFVLFFSSLQSQSKAPGQANYAAGCTFADAYAQALGQNCPWPVKVVNWGYWGSIGVVASQAYRERMAQAGIGSVEAPEAMAFLERLLCSPLKQVAFLKSTRPEVAQAFRGALGGPAVCSEHGAALAGGASVKAQGGGFTT